MKLLSAIICLFALVCQIGAGVLASCDSCRHHEDSGAGQEVASEPHSHSAGCSHAHHVSHSQSQLQADDHEHSGLLAVAPPHQHTPCSCSEVNYEFEKLAVVNVDIQLILPTAAIVRIDEFPRCDVITASSAPPWGVDVDSPSCGGFYAIRYGAFLL